jgi:hypothetical protein
MLCCAVQVIITTTEGDVYRLNAFTLEVIDANPQVQHSIA